MNNKATRGNEWTVATMTQARSTASPVIMDPLDTVPTKSPLPPNERIPNTLVAVSLIAFLLGCAFNFSFSVFTMGLLGFRSMEWVQLGWYGMTISLFHLAEFVVTAGWNRDKCSVDCKFQLLFHHFAR